MPRRSRGLGSGSQGPLRGISNLASNLPPAQQDRLSSAFEDAEDLLTFHSLNVPEKQNKRKISGLVKQIEITATSSVLGGFVSWSRLDDPRISLYEIQISDDNVFSTADTYQILDTFFSVEGITTTSFVRVRGVRLDGETGIWSETKQLDPTFSAPKTHSAEFYPLYNLPDSNPEVPNTLVYSGGLNPKGEQDFYTILTSSFYIDRLNGGLMLWGYVSNRLDKLTETTNVPWDRVRFTVNGIHRLDNYYSHWTNAFSIDGSTVNDRTPSGTPMTFYARGGYTAAFGPYAVAVPNTLSGQGPNDANKITAQDAPDGTFYWQDPYNARYPSRFDQAQLTAYSDPLPAHEAEAFNVGASKKTHWIIFQDFKFNLPEDAAIIGIQADIKRRQSNIIENSVSSNLGIKRPDRALGDDLVLEYLATNLNPPPIRANTGPAYILEDVNWGKYLDLTAGFGGTNSGQLSGRLAGDTSGSGADGEVQGAASNADFTKLYTGNQFSVSAWFKVSPLIAGTGVLNTHDVVSTLGESEDGSTITAFAMFIIAPATSNRITQYVCEVNFAGFFKNQANFAVPVDDPATLVNQFHHMVMTWDRDVDVFPNNDGTLKLYVDGTLRLTGTADGVFDKFTYTDVIRNLAIGGAARGISGSTNGTFTGGMAQVAIWDGVLSANAVRSIYQAKGNADLRFDFGSYRGYARNLNHYFLVFQDQADIKDEKVVLVDRTGVRTDLHNKAEVDESWPQLGQFFYTSLRQCGLPLAVSDGIPHDNHLAIGYQSYGHELDLWGAPAWFAETINDFYFGLAIQAKNDNQGVLLNNAYIDHARMTVYTLPKADREIEFSISAAVANAFYLERSVFGASINGISVGQLTDESIS